MKKTNLIFSINFVTIIRLFRRYILGIKPIVHSHNLSLKRDKWDDRDFIYKVKGPYAPAPKDTLRENIKKLTFVYDQGPLGSCGLNAFDLVKRRVLQVNGQPDCAGSRLFGYYVSRSDDTKSEDSGVTLRDMFKAMNKYGICHESTWPYDISKFAEKPSAEAFKEAGDHQAMRYERIFPITKEAIMDAISQHYPIVYGLTLYESFMSEKTARTGIVPIPKCWEKAQGGHALAGFDYNPDVVPCQNSWGSEWGMKGQFDLPWELLLNRKYCTDVWVLYKSE
jgi:C1A family cysteine protease